MEPMSEHKKHGFDFKLYKSERLEDTKTGKQKWKAIYVANGNIEVVIMHESEPHPIFNPDGDSKLSLPSSSKWGELGWSYSNLELAVEKFNSL